MTEWEMNVPVEKNADNFRLPWRALAELQAAYWRVKWAATKNGVPLEVEGAIRSWRARCKEIGKKLISAESREQEQGLLREKWQFATE